MTQRDECVIWTGYIDADGYARTPAGQATRVLWRKHRGPIPAGHDLHHTCHNRACVNLDHLEPGPRGAHVAWQYGVSHVVVWQIVVGRNYAGVI
jgi:HNH endonuclease